MDNLGSFTDNVDVFLLHNPSHQDFITPGPPLFLVPEPAPLALLGVALIALMVVRQQRIRKPAA